MFLSSKKKNTHDIQPSRTPMRAVLEAIDAGSNTVEDISASTGVNKDTVSTILEQLTRMGRLHSSVETVCSGVCGSCSSSTCGHGGVHNPAMDHPAMDQKTKGKGLHILSLKVL